MAIEAHSYIVDQQPIEPLKWVILAKFLGRFCPAKTLIGMRATITDYKRKRSQSPLSRRVKSFSGSNDPSVTYDLFNKGDYNLAYCERAHRCKGCGSKDHGLLECTKGQKRWRLGASGIGTMKELVDVVEVDSLANKNSLHQFICAFPCLSAPPRPNTAIRFRLADASKRSQTNSPSLLWSSAWADLLLKYPGALRIDLLMILRFGVELGYEGSLDAFSLSDNLASALTDQPIIYKKLTEDLEVGRVVVVEKLIPPFIFSLLRLVRKHNGGWKGIHDLSHPRSESVNDHIPDGKGELRYTRF